MKTFIFLLKIFNIFWLLFNIFVYTFSPIMCVSSINIKQHLFSPKLSPFQPKIGSVTDFKLMEFTIITLVSVFRGERKDEGGKNRWRQNIITNQGGLVQRCLKRVDWNIKQFEIKIKHQNDNVLICYFLKRVFLNTC